MSESREARIREIEGVATELRRQMGPATPNSVAYAPPYFWECYRLLAIVDELVQMVKA
jgi:hypothetical protein